MFFSVITLIHFYTSKSFRNLIITYLAGDTRLYAIIKCDKYAKGYNVDI